MTTVLLVDDEALVREELGGILEDEGYSVITAGDGDEGLAKYRDQRPDMVITDARMPRREGLSLARAIFEVDEHVPITMITGHGNETMAIEALRLGITDFIKKPVQIADLLTALGRMEGAARLSEERADSDSALPDSSRLLSRTRRYEFQNDVDAVPAFVNVVIREFASNLETRRRDSLQLALREIIINAVEHGNLAITYDEKTEETDLGTLEILLAERASQVDYKERVVHIAITQSAKELTIVVEDEGEGFDWRRLPDPTDPSNLLISHGRGVLISQLSVDRLSFNEKGNEVTISMDLHPQ